jgi:hypothetical protein
MYFCHEEGNQHSSSWGGSTLRFNFSNQESKFLTRRCREANRLPSSFMLLDLEWSMFLYTPSRGFITCVCMCLCVYVTKKHVVSLFMLRCWVVAPYLISMHDAALHGFESRYTAKQRQR